MKKIIMAGTNLFIILLHGGKRRIRLRTTICILILKKKSKSELLGKMVLFTSIRWLGNRG